MPKATFSQNSFNFGEISPRCLGRYDAEKPIWKNGADTLENFLNWQMGGVMFWPGTTYICEVKDSANPVVLRKFRYSIDQSYVMEIGAGYIRFLAAKGQLVTGGSPVEVSSTPYAQNHIAYLQFANKADVMYIVHPSYAPYKLIRTSATSFSFNAVSFVRGPFLDTNITATTISPSAAYGTGVVLTASQSIFDTTSPSLHIGSLWRINSSVTATDWITGHGYVAGDYVIENGIIYNCVTNHTSGTFLTDLIAGLWSKRNSIGAVVKITAVNSATEAVGDVQVEPDGTAGNIGGTGNYTDWAEGAFSDYRGWPTAVTFHEQRLDYGGTLAQPQFIFGSVIGAYDNFDSGAVGDSDAYKYEVSSDLVNAIRWLSSNTTLQIGTNGGTFTAQGSAGTGITPKSISITPDTDYAVMSLIPSKIASYLYYMQSNGFQLRQLVFDLYLNKQKTEDMTLLADHILRDGLGVVDTDRQQSPNDRLWCVRKDGQLAVFTRNAEQQILAWCRRIGGSTAAGPGFFESICILAQDGDDDVIYTVVNRIVNGSVKRYIEYFTPEVFNNDWEPVRLDCCLSYNVPVNIFSITLSTDAPAPGNVKVSAEVIPAQTLGYATSKS